MVKCDHCHSRKGKRTCPYLKGHICSVCCGENRGVRFDCPRDCPWFEPAAREETPAAAGAATGRPGPAGAAAGRSDAARPGAPPSAPPSQPASPAGQVPGDPAPDLSRYQKFLASNRRALADLMARLEFAIARYDRDRSGLTDSEAADALEYLRRRASPILAVERFAPEVGVFLEKALVEMHRGEPAPGPYDLMEILDHLIGIVRNFGPPGSRRYLDEVRLLEERSRAASGGPASEPASRIILPR